MYNDEDLYIKLQEFRRIYGKNAEYRIREYKHLTIRIMFSLPQSEPVLIHGIRHVFTVAQNERTNHCLLRASCVFWLNFLATVPHACGG